MSRSTLHQPAVLALSALLLLASGSLVPALAAQRGGRPPGGPGQGGAAVPGGGGRGPAGGRGATPGRTSPGQGTTRRSRLPDALGTELGEYGTEYAQPRDEVVAAHPIHQDTTGGCAQVLELAAGSPTGGFVGVWRDHRAANASLFLGFLNGDGEVVGTEQPMTQQLGTARELDAGLAVGPGHRGAFVWMKTGPNPRAHLRFFAPKAEWSGAIPLGSRDFNRAAAASKGPRGPQDEDIGVPSLPDVAIDESGQAAVTWQESGRAFLQIYERRYPTRPPVRINPGGLPARDRIRPVYGPKGRLLCAWTTRAGVRVWCSQGERMVHQGAAGEGQLLGACVDLQGGWWLLVRAGDKVLLRHLDAAGEPDRPDATVMVGSMLGASLTTWSRGVAVCVERVAPGRPAPAPAPVEGEDGAGKETPPRRVLTLVLLGPNGEKGPDPVLFEASPLSRGSCIASESPLAERLLLTWTDRRGGQDDVMTVLITPAEAGSGGPVQATEPRPWNTDVGSADQLHGEIDSNGRVAVAVWQDDRAGPGRIHHRRLGASGRWLGDEVPVDVDPDTDPLMRRASVAVAEDGRYLVTWKEALVEGRAFRIRGQVFDPGGEALGAPFDLDPGLTAFGNWAAAVDTLPRDRGWVVVWVREGYGPVARRISLSGKPAGKAWDLADGRGEGARNPAVAVLDDGRCIALWDFIASDKIKVLSGRFLAPDATPEGRVLSFDYGGDGGDLDPEVVGADDGGFLLAWTTREGPGRDTVARFFDREGRPAGPPLALSVTRNEQDYVDVLRLADGDWLVAWEDDLSAVDHVVARRIRRSGEGGAQAAPLGPRFTLDPRLSAHKEVRHAPRIAPLGEGFAALWADASRNLGQDVFLRVLGAGFDAGLEESGREER